MCLCMRMAYRVYFFKAHGVELLYDGRLLVFCLLKLDLGSYSIDFLSGGTNMDRLGYLN